MKALCCTFAAVLAFNGVSQTPLQSAATKVTTPSDREKFIGARHLVSLGADAKPNSLAGLKGMLLYTRDGHMSVQLMYPKSAYGLTNEYVKNGYEASFGSYDVNEEAHTVIHHVQGSITEGLVGKDLPRAFQFTDDRRLIIKSTRPDEHWSVIWEHY